MRRPEEQAICAFVLRAIARSGRHSMLMSIYVGAGLALMVTSVLPDPIALRLERARRRRASPTLALPLVLSAALAVGVRILITIPAEMGARWIFQTTAIAPRRVDAAAHKAMLLLVVPPVVLHGRRCRRRSLWGGALAGLHAVYCGALSSLLCEVLLVALPRHSADASVRARADRASTCCGPSTSRRS